MPLLLICVLFLSIGAARRGDDSGAVSNAFGSNIFDICVSLSVPLLVNSYLLGWEPVPLTSDGEPIEGLVDLRILLAVLTLSCNSSGTKSDVYLPKSIDSICG